MEKQLNGSTERSRSVPKLRFPEFKGEWEKKKLGEVFSIFNGYAFASNESVENGTLWVKIADVGIQEMKKDNLSFLPISFNKKHSKFLLKKGDFVIALTRPILNGKLKMAQIDDFFNDSLLNQRVGKIETNNSKEFIYSYLQKDDLIKAIENNIAGSDPPNLSPSEINTIQLAIPSIPEQSRIASFFSAIDEKLKLETQRIAALKQYKKGVMQKLFSQELRFKDENGKEFPDWEVKKLEEVLDIQGGYAFKSNLFNQGNIKVIRIGDIVQNIELKKFSGVFSSETPQDKFLVKKNDFVMALSGATFGKVGKIKDDDVAYINQRVAIFKTKFCLEFFYQLVQSDDFKNYINSIPTASAQPNISNSDILNYLSKIPEVIEQTKIANFLSAIDDKIDCTQSKIQQMQEYKKGLLQQMFC